MSDIIVPERWAEFAFEYKEGYRSAAKAWKWNPVSYRSGSGQAREAWFAGRRRALREAKRHA